MSCLIAAQVPAVDHCLPSFLGAVGDKSFTKIKVKNAIVDLDGDEMTRCASVLQHAVLLRTSLMYMLHAVHCTSLM